MSPGEDARFTDEPSDRAVSSTASTDALIGLFSDEYARELLGAIRHEAKSGRTLASECGMSRTTVYRRLNRLQDAGLVTERMEYDSDGHHRRKFGVAVENVEVELGDAGFEAELTVDDS